MNDWNGRVSVKKGKLGEDIVRQYLESKGYVIYSPETNGSHPFDKLCINHNGNEIFIAEIKSKPHRIYYPDTGINKNHFLKYKFIQDKYSIDVFLFFVDEISKSIYGNWLSKLIKPRKDYPLEQNGIIYFPLDIMLQIAKLEDKQVEELKSLSDRNYDYSQFTDN